MKAWKLVLPALLVAAAVAMVPQDPQAAAQQTPTEHAAIASLSDLRYMTLQGTEVVVSARTVVEIRVHEERGEHIRLELLYENGDYSMLDTQGFHLLRNGGTAREVKLVRCKQAAVRFPRLLP